MELDNAKMLASALAKRDSDGIFNHREIQDYLSGPFVGNDGNLFHFLPERQYPNAGSGISHSGYLAGLIRNEVAREVVSGIGSFEKYLNHDESFMHRIKDARLLKSIFSDGEMSWIFDSEFPFSLWAWINESFRNKGISHINWKYSKESPLLVAPEFVLCASPVKKQISLGKFQQFEEGHSVYKKEYWAGEKPILKEDYMEVMKNLNESLAGIIKAKNDRQTSNADA